MRYTFGEAKALLAPYASAYGLLDIGQVINTALDELSRARNWKRLTRLVQFHVTSEFFSLPQECGSIIRALIENTPVAVRSTEYEFLSGGPGALDAFCNAGRAPLHGIQMLGVYPTANALAGAGHLVAVTTKAPKGPLRVRGFDAAGRSIVASVPVVEWGENDTIDTFDFSGAATTEEAFIEITSVNVPIDGVEYLTLVALPAAADSLGVGQSEQLLSRFHPRFPIPEFTRYRIPGLWSGRKGGYRIIAEVGLRFLPLLDDNDVLPFDSILPLQFMMQSIRAMETGEVSTADSYRDRAASLLGAREEIEQEKQGPLVVNHNMDISPGVIGERYHNI